MQSHVKAYCNLLSRHYRVTAPPTMQRGSVTVFAGPMPHSSPAVNSGFHAIVFYNTGDQPWIQWLWAQQIWASVFARYFFKLRRDERKALVQLVLPVAPQHRNFSRHLERHEPLLLPIYSRWLSVTVVGEWQTPMAHWCWGSKHHHWGLLWPQANLP